LKGINGAVQIRCTRKKTDGGGVSVARERTGVNTSGFESRSAPIHSGGAGKVIPNKQCRIRLRSQTYDRK
jgi:hypothetical protein